MIREVHRRSEVLDEYEDALEKDGEAYVPDEALVRATHYDLMLFELFVKSFSIGDGNTVLVERDEIHNRVHIEAVRA